MKKMKFKVKYSTRLGSRVVELINHVEIRGLSQLYLKIQFLWLTAISIKCRNQ